jgi:hypothetical protein
MSDKLHRMKSRGSILIGKLADKAVYSTRVARFLALKRARGCTINPGPAFDKEGLDAFELAIKDTHTYLEFGSGGSTILASQFVTKLVSVETDHFFAAAVRRALPRSSAEIHILTPNIGLTREWGYPIFRRPTPGRVAKWKRLPKAPWGILATDIPDTILIDGRMRVACALESLLHVTSDTRLLIDDYVGRSYEAIECFATLIALHGRMAEFRKLKMFDESVCLGILETAYSQLL